MKYRGALIAGLLLALSGCNAVKDGVGDSRTAALQKLDSSIEYLGPENETLPARLFPRNVVLLFPYIPGGIFGNPDSSPLFVVSLSEKRSFTLNLESAGEELKKSAAPLKSEWLDNGLSISPEETRLARVGTFAFNARTREELGAGGFMEAKSRDFLILVYVDRACDITGLLDTGSRSYQHNIHFTSPGFHWIHVIPVRDDERVLEAYRGQGEVKFIIQLLNLSPV